MLLSLIGLGYLVWWWASDGAGEKGHLTLYGSIELRDAQLAFRESERIARVLVEEGDAVSKGQLLAELETNRLTAELAEVERRREAQSHVLDRLERGTRPQAIEQARAEVDGAAARLANARRDLERFRQTSRTGATSRQSLDEVESKVEVAEAEWEARKQALELAVEGPRQEDIAAARATLEARRAAVELMRVRRGDAALHAPSDGIIQSRILEPGEMADPSRPVLTLALTAEKWARTYVPETDLGRIRPGMPARIYSDSFPDDPLEGWIGFISPVAEFTPKSVHTPDLRTSLVYEVRVHVRDPQDRLRLGMPVTIIVDTDAVARRETPGTSPGSSPGIPSSEANETESPSNRR